MNALYLSVVGLFGLFILLAIVRWLNGLELETKSPMKSGIEEDFMSFLKYDEDENPKS